MSTSVHIACPFPSHMQLSPWRLDRPEFASILAIVREQRYQRGATLYTPGTLLDEIFIVKSGLLRLYIISPQGKELSLPAFGPGTMVCEQALFNEKLSYACAEAVGEVTVYCLSKADLEAVLQSDSRLMLLAYKTMAAKLDYIMACLHVFMLQDMEQKVLWVLRQLAATGRGGAEKREGLSVKVTHEQLAAMIGASRSAVTQCLDAMAAAGIITKSRGRITLSELAG
ncbi:transcriptional regulator, Crp/Fnr family [Thermosinus carboxydivorans Nor1]|uniref:Transcriptional regulator, Crp/Fnr family n=1 Tax=Thermosinus carboxydivorans Nor1 TaxID=401526 RepID=A1HNB5_9FIRM|nr:Crp/Fnr family transcriptional regulator [Thermosinus carboxydivorans]EAX48279.1 transcriptional regulator, Crp/Fnr family [Thermosinus carboxydivorans Nor1]